MLIESGVEERNGKDAAQGRRLEKLRRDFGPVFLAAPAVLGAGTSGGQTLRTLKGHMGWVRAVAVTPDGLRAFSGSSDQTLRPLGPGERKRDRHFHRRG